VLPLGQLGPAAIADMPRACLDAADLPDEVHGVVAERAEGIPFLVEEILAGLVGEGALTERDGRWYAAGLGVPRACPAPGARWPLTWPGGRARRPRRAHCCLRPGGVTWLRARWPAPSTR
jgi:hypothetical protein